MKKLRLIKNISLYGSTIAAITPITISLSNCAPRSISVIYTTYDKILVDKKYSYSNYENISFRKLLYGSKKFKNGNYVLLIGSNVINKCCEFFTGEDDLITSDFWHNIDYFNESIFYKGLLETIGEKDDEGEERKIKDFGIFNIIDFCPNKICDKKGHKIYISLKDGEINDKIDPWQKWTNEIIAQTKIVNRDSPESYNWNDESVSTKQYIRNDSSAIAFRAFSKTAKALYPKADGSREEFIVDEIGRNVVQVAVFVNGKLVSKDDITSMNEWKKIIIDNFSENNKEDE